MKRFRLHIVIFVFLNSLLSACIEQIELDFDGDGDRLVIFGNINTAGFEQKIEIYRITSIQNRFLPISADSVMLISHLVNDGRMYCRSEYLSL